MVTRNPHSTFHLARLLLCSRTFLFFSGCGLMVDLSLSTTTQDLRATCHELLGLMLNAFYLSEPVCDFGSSLRTLQSDLHLMKQTTSYDYIHELIIWRYVASFCLLINQGPRFGFSYYRSYKILRKLDFSHV